ncbi:MAG TPA: alkaline phosphatase D family protein [Lacipirellulaceae bacterium]|nr:alkaline phosphatase D family protein [Lacipirellulaceae bacterium]
MLDPSQLHDAVRREGGLSRRLFLAYAASLSSTCLTLQRARGGAPPARFVNDPFSLGVASGDPAPRSVVLWTRLAPAPLEPFGGMPAENVEVHWEIARDEAFQSIVDRGTTVATPQLAHAVHVEPAGLQPDRWYWYRFRAGDAESPVGRTRTLPRRTATPDEVKFAFASCQHLEAGWYTAYEQMAADALDLVFHLGDYIYEGRGKAGGVRRHQGREIRSLADYRIRHAQYKTDPLLQAMHAQCPWIVVWDDHEVDNNYASDIAEQGNIDPVEFLVRRANAYQAYYEHMPLRRRSLPRGPHLQLYRKFAWGRLAEFFGLDTRQHRSDQPNGDGRQPLNDAARSSANTMLGHAQRDWLQQGLLSSTGAWNGLAQQVMMAVVDQADGPDELFSMDSWSGYVQERDQLMRFLRQRRVANPVVLTGDIHTNWVNDLRIDDRREDSPVTATEFVGTSISSGGNGADNAPRRESLMAENPGVRFFNGQRGYVRCTVTKDRWQSDYQVVDQVTQPGGRVTTRASFVVESGQPGAQPA